MTPKGTTATMPNPLLILMQTTTNGGFTWDDVGIVQMIEPEDGDTPYHVGMDYAAANDPGHRSWRVKVWPASELGEPVTIGPHDLAPAARTVRAGKALHRPRTRGPVFKVHSNFDDFERTTITEDLIGRRALITNQADNCAGTPYGFTGWHPAQRPREGTSALIRGVGRLTFRGTDLRTLHTPIGEVWTPADQKIYIERT